MESEPLLGTVPPVPVTNQQECKLSAELSSEHNIFHSPVACTQAVSAESVRKRFGAVSVLKGVDLHVEQGKIYGLLGPSGCGKSTLLKCIIGRLTHDSGRVLVLGKAPGAPGSKVPGPKVGYMPQELALYNEFTAKETLKFTGKLFNCPDDYIRVRTKFLLSFLDIEGCKDQLVKTMSGGQQRRLSLAVALLQELDLMILDEPTVGVDPLLRKRIWDYLTELTQVYHKTIIITTHYIEEARKADKVGLMLKGRILVEDNPEELLQKFKQPSLEDVFLHLCYKDESDPAEEVFSESEDLEFPAHVAVHENDKTATSAWSPWSMRRVLPRLFSVKALVWGNMVRYLRTIPLLIFQFLLPAIQIAIFCLCIGSNPKGLKVYVNNQDSGFFGDLLTRELSKSDLHLLTSSSFEDAVSDVREGKAWGVINMYPSLTTSLLERYSGNETLTNDIITNGTIYLSLDQSNSQNYIFIQQTVTRVFEITTATLLASMGRSPELVSLPVEVTPPIYGKENPKFTDFIAPGMIINILFAQSIIMTALNVVGQKKGGLLDRLWVTGTRPTEFIFAQVFLQMFIVLIQISLLLAVALGIFKITFEGSLALVFLLALVLGLAGMMYGLLVSSAAHDERSAMQIASGSFFPLLLMSGIIWPLEAIPYSIRWLSYCVPTTWTAEALRSIVSRGWGLSNSHVYAGFIASLVWTIVCFAGALRGMKSKD